MKKATILVAMLALVATLALAASSLHYSATIIAPDGNSFASGITFSKAVFNNGGTVKAITVGTANGSPFPTCTTNQPMVQFLDVNTSSGFSINPVGGDYTDRTAVGGLFTIINAGDTVKAQFTGGSGCPSGTQFAVNAVLEYQ